MKTILPSFYSEYGRYVNRFRMIPFYIDMLKPVERRLLLSLFEVASGAKKVKSAKVIGNTIARYHPHGDQSTYGALVRLVQNNFAEGRGNWGAEGLNDAKAGAYRYCITKDSLIYTENGIERFDDLKPNIGEDININVYTANGKLKQATKFFDCGKHPIIEIETLYGYKLKGTENHPILTLTKDFQFTWKTFDKIRTGDVAILRSIDHHSTNNTNLSKSDAVILGCLTSEGWFTPKNPNKIGFNNTNQSYSDRFREALKSVGINKFSESTSTLPSTKTLMVTEICNPIHVSYIENLGFEKCYSIKRRIPSKIWKSNKTLQSIFLSYLFEGDGSFVLGARNTYTISYTSSSINLLHDIQNMLLMSFGIVSQIKEKENKLLIIGISSCLKFQQCIGFLGNGCKDVSLKSALMKDVKARAKHDYVPFLREHILSTYKNLISYNIYKKLKSSCFTTKSELQSNLPVLSKFVSRDDLDRIKLILDEDLVFLNIKNVNRLDEDNVYSIRVNSNCHSFISNGFINHNTECKLSQWVKSMAFRYIEYVPWETLELEPEPLFLPSPIPLGLIGSDIITGISFYTTTIPQYKISDLSKRLIWLLDGKTNEPPIIKPNAKGCRVIDSTNTNQFEKILTEGIGSLLFIPEGEMRQNSFVIKGRAPGTSFSKLKNAIDDDHPKRKKGEKLIDATAIELSGKGIKVEITPDKKNADIKALATEVWNKYLNHKINFNVTIVYDESGRVKTCSIDEILLTNYQHWTSAVLNEKLKRFQQVCQKYITNKIIEGIRQIVTEEPAMIDIETLSILYMKKFPNQIINVETYNAGSFILFPYTVTAKDIEQIAGRKSIKNLIEHSLECDSILKEIKEIKLSINNNDNECRTELELYL